MEDPEDIKQLEAHLGLLLDALLAAHGSWGNADCRKCEVIRRSMALLGRPVPDFTQLAKHDPLFQFFSS